MMSYVYGNAYASMPQASPQQQSQQQLETQQYSTASYHQSNSTFYEDISRQLAAASSTIRRRHSRSSQYGSRTPGSAMRIGKPSSANNSPQSSSVSSATMQARKRMTVNSQDVAGLYTSPHQNAPQLATGTGAHQDSYLAINSKRYDTSVEAAAARPARPVSWHPSSTYLMPNQQTSYQFQIPLSLATNFQAPAQYSAYTTPALSASDYNDTAFPSMQPFTLSPAAASYSNQASPATAFSPYLGNFENNTTGQYYSPNPWALSPSVYANGALFDNLPSPVDCPALITGTDRQQQCTEQHQQMAATAQIFQEQQVQNQKNQSYQQTAALDTSSTSSSSEWNAFATYGFDHTAAPRTPPDSNVSGGYFAAAEPAQVVDVHAADCQALEQGDQSTDGEVLVGMGLYDPPEKEVVDPTLQSYRSSVAQLLGTAYKFPEPAGKGLKLEDSWEPPENMDDDDNDEEDGENEHDTERDAEGEDQ